MTGNGDATALRQSGEAADREFSTRDAGRTAENCGEPTWIEIQLIGEDDQPIPGAKYLIKMPDGSVREGVLDQEGVAGFDGISAGNCKVGFPELDKDAWGPIAVAVEPKKDQWP
jgi:hypothetical protein